MRRSPARMTLWRSRTIRLWVRSARNTASWAAATRLRCHSERRQLIGEDGAPHLQTPARLQAGSSQQRDARYRNTAPT